MARAGGALRGALAAWLGLIALDAVGRSGATNRITELMGDVDRLVGRFLDPTVPAIPNLAGGETWGTGVDPVVPGLGRQGPAPRGAAAPRGGFHYSPY